MRVLLVIVVVFSLASQSRGGEKSDGPPVEFYLDVTKVAEFPNAAVDPTAGTIVLALDYSVLGNYFVSQASATVVGMQTAASLGFSETSLANESSLISAYRAANPGAHDALVFHGTGVDGPLPSATLDLPATSLYSLYHTNGPNAAWGTLDLVSDEPIPTVVIGFRVGGSLIEGEPGSREPSRTTITARDPRRSSLNTGVSTFADDAAAIRQLPEVHSFCADGQTRVILEVFATETAEPVLLSLDGRGPGPRDEGAGRLTDLAGNAATLHPSGLQTLRLLPKPFDGGYVTHAVVHAPEDFIRPSTLVPGDSWRPDAGASSRGVQLRASREGAAVTSLGVFHPPLILVHGFEGTPGSFFPDFWFGVDELWPAAQYFFDYSDSSSGPVQPNADALGRYIRNYVLDDLLKDGIAATQVDVAAHSYGAVTTRYYVSSASAAGDYRRTDNYNAGDVRRLVSIFGPHNGSPLADRGEELLDTPVLGHLVGLIISMISDIDTNNGAIQQLRTDTPQPAADVPVHYIIGADGDDLFEDDDRGPLFLPPDEGKLRRALGPLPNIQYDCVWLPYEDHDGVVPAASAANGLVDFPTRSNVSIFFDEAAFPGDPATGVHTHGPRDPRIGRRVGELLAAPTAGAIAAPDDYSGASLFDPGLLPYDGDGLIRPDCDTLFGLGGGASLHIEPLPMPWPAPGANLYLSGPTVIINANVTLPEGIVPDFFIITLGDQVILREGPFDPFYPGFLWLDIFTLRLGETPFQIFAFAGDRIFASELIDVRLLTTATPQGLIIDDNDILLDAAYPSFRPRIRAVYSNGVPYDVASIISSTDPSVVEVTEDGTLRAVSIGQAEITAEFEDVQLTATVRVESLPEPAACPADLDGDTLPGTIGDFFAGLGQLQSGADFDGDTLPGTIGDFFAMLAILSTACP